MTAIHAGNQTVEIWGKLPKVGSSAPDFLLTTLMLNDVSLAHFSGQPIVMNLFPSLNTPVCACSVLEVEKLASKYPAIHFLCISADLPFAQEMFCKSEGVTERITPLSVFRAPAFGKVYGLGIKTGSLRGLLSRAILLIDAHKKIAYTEHVADMLNEPDYLSLEAAICALG